MPESEDRQPSPGRSPVFQTTHWSVVLQAASEDSTAALESLCRVYWYPLYAFVRRKGYIHEEAQDSTQAFLAKLLEKNQISLADPERGRFRTFPGNSFADPRRRANQPAGA